MIKFLDLHKINARFEDQFKSEFNTFLNSGRYILGDGLKRFETKTTELPIPGAGGQLGRF